MSIPYLSSILVSATLVLASGSKLVNLSWFISKVEKYGKMRRPVAWVIGTIVVLTEGGVGLWMLISVRKTRSAYAAIGLLMFFTVVAAVNLAARNGGECGCFPFAPTLRLGWRLIVRNLGFSLLAWLSMSPGSLRPTESLIFGLVVFMILCALAADVILGPNRKGKSGAYASLAVD
jgi:Methylamine utilisation protein MauE